MLTLFSSPLFSGFFCFFFPLQKQSEETGGYFEDVLKLLDKNVWLKDSLPWGKLSKYPGLDASESDDGPIMWTCPGRDFFLLLFFSFSFPFFPSSNTNGLGLSGEQIVSVADLQAGPNQPGQKRKRTVLDRLTTQARNEKQREKLVEDRTGCHADMAGYFPDRHPVAAVGFVQSVDT